MYSRTCGGPVRRNSVSNIQWRDKGECPPSDLNKNFGDRGGSQWRSQEFDLGARVYVLTSHGNVNVPHVNKTVTDFFFWGGGIYTDIHPRRYAPGKEQRVQMLSLDSWMSSR